MVKQKLRDVRVRVNRRAVPLAARLCHGDEILVTPIAPVAPAARFARLDLERYRREMTPADYAWFVSFVGADRFGIRPGDLDPH